MLVSWLRSLAQAVALRVCLVSYISRQALSAVQLGVITEVVVRGNVIAVGLAELPADFISGTADSVDRLWHCGSREGVHLMHESADPHDPHQEGCQEDEPESHST